MSFGFYGQDNRLVAVPSRQCLGLHYIQEALRDASRVEGFRLRCGCGRGNLIPFLDRRFPAEVYNVRRESEDDQHPPGCFAGELGTFAAPAVVYAPGAFYTPRPGSKPAEAAGGATRRVRYGSFTHLAHQVYARASMRAFRQANLGKTYRDIGVRPFTTDGLHAALRDVFQNTEYGGGLSLASMLQTHGLEVGWGITNAPLGDILAGAASQRCDCQFFVNDVRLIRGGRAAREIKVPVEVAARGGGRRSVMGKPLAPPYCVMVVLDARPHQQGALAVYTAMRIVAFPVAASDAPYAVESEFERDVIVARHREGVAMLKPGVHYALGELGPEWWNFGLLPNGRLPHRPDLLVFTKRRCWIIELAGLDANPVYLEGVDERLRQMIATAANESVKPHRVDRLRFYQNRPVAR